MIIKQQSFLNFTFIYTLTDIANKQYHLFLCMISFFILLMDYRIAANYNEDSTINKKKSLDQKYFTEMVTPKRNIEKAMGKESYELTEKQIAGKAFARSLYVAEDIKAGEVITEKNVRSVRPGFGLHPRDFGVVIGKKSTCDISKGEPFQSKFIK